MIRQTLLVAMTLFTMWWLFDGNTKAEKMPPVLETGILGSGACWYDTERLIVVKRSSFKPGEESEVEGLYVVTPSKPREAIRIDLTPVEPELQRRIWDVSCQDGTILFSVRMLGQNRMRLYGMKIGARPELFIETEGMMSQNVSMKGKYVLANKRLVNTGVSEDKKDCTVPFARPEFRVHCVDKRFFVRRWLLVNFVLTEYRWSDTVTVLGQDGQRKTIPNPEKQLIDKSGRPINYAVFLRALDGTILAQLNEVGPLSTSIYTDFFVDDDEMYLYSPCHRRGTSDGSSDGICRYPLTGKLESWEQIFHSEIPHQHKASISYPKMSRTGDIYFIIGGTKPPYHGVWKYHAATKHVTQLTNPGNFDDTPTAISPDGRWVAFTRTGTVDDSVFLVPGGRNDNH